MSLLHLTEIGLMLIKFVTRSCDIIKVCVQFFLDYEILFFVAVDHVVKASSHYTANLLRPVTDGNFLSPAMALYTSNLQRLV